MNPFSELVRFNINHNNAVKRFCIPIYNYFNINHFWYHNITNDGHYTCLGSHAAWTEYYFSDNLYLPNPYLRSPDNFSTGINFIRSVEDNVYLESIDVGIEKFNLNQSLLFLEKTESGVKGYGFASCGPSNSFEALCINELPLLKLFIKRFKENFDPIIKKMQDHSVDLPSLIGPSFYKNNLKTQITLTDNDKNNFIKELQLPDITSLSKRERLILEYVYSGYSASQIAKHLFLSPRTIEHYIENIRNKLNCHSKFELIQIAQEFANLGYFIP